MPQADPQDRTRAEEWAIYPQEYEAMGVSIKDLRLFHVAELHDNHIYHHYYWLPVNEPDKAGVIADYFVGNDGTGYAMNAPQEVAPFKFDPADPYWPNQVGDCSHVPYLW